ncbi:hypothetical protein IscW_ISCW022535 [Ixodes scapularis]|uniref:Alpha-2-macroglobulin bait region domain-containing protein n=1 Tax=Ixodes scapularis TaxID=6945 RepID=B7QCX0_IXOSC|nr:hypothetical protein IscW_ISCW022535 [Ixodes scapularis]|eukprot:XP_002413384.1 hypothetical protein IscW_ISCW022535 [Ixodes scapularis]
MRSKRWGALVKGNRFVVEADVLDKATSKRESTIDDSAIFASSPYLVTFKSTPKDFKPGTSTMIVAEIKHVNGKPAIGIPTELTALDDREEAVLVDTTSSTSDNTGRVAFSVQTSRFQTALKIKVISRGQTKAHGKVNESSFYKTFGFQVTPEMSPGARVLVYAFHEGHLLADSMNIEVEEVCTGSSDIEIEPEFRSEEPGSSGVLNVRGREGTRVGILAVDKAVYILKNKELLTREKKRDRLGRTCQARADIVYEHMDGKDQAKECSEAFEECCKEIRPQGFPGRRDPNLQATGDERARHGIEFITEDSVDEVDGPSTSPLVRRDFRETWLFDEGTVG